MTRTRAALALALLAVVAPAPAVAVERTAAEVRALAARGADDAAALAALRDTDAVDGRPADLRAALDAAGPEDLAARLRALARPVAAGTPRTGAAEDARAILREGRFAQARDPQAREGLGARIRGWISDRFDGLDGLVPGPSGVALALLGGLVLLVAAVLTSRVTSRIQLAAEPRLTGGRGRAADPAALDREAAAAEAGGDFAAAVRLRFAAGLLRLDAADAIRLRPSLTTGQVGRELDSARFDALARTFDEVAYGGRPAQPADAEAAREAWPQVLQEAGR